MQAEEVGMAPELDQPVSECSGLQIVPAQAAAVVCTNRPSLTTLGLAVYVPLVAVFIQSSAFPVTRIRLAVLLALERFVMLCYSPKPLSGLVSHCM